MAELASFSETSRQRALERFELLRAHIEDGRPLAAIARETRLSYRMLQYWLERYRTSGLAALARKPRTDRGRRRKLSAALQEAIEGLALQKPPLPISVLCNRAQLLAESLGEEPPSYDLVYDVISNLPADLVTLAHRGAKAYSDSFELVYRREAGAPNAIWQADHSPLDIELVQSELDPKRTGKPWLTIILDDYSRAVAGYFLSFEAPSTLNTALALRQAIWRKEDARWKVCGFRKFSTRITAATLLPGIWNKSQRTSKCGLFSRRQAFRVAEAALSASFHRSIRCFYPRSRASNVQEAKGDSRWLSSMFFFVNLSWRLIMNVRTGRPE